MHNKTKALHMVNIHLAMVVRWSRGLLRQRHAVRFLACLVSILLLCALAACGSGSPVNLDSQGTPTADEQVPEPRATYPAAMQTSLVPGPVSTVGLTLPPATAQAQATARAATATHVAIARATAEIVMQATWQAVANATSFAEGTAFVKQVATRQAAETHEARATKTAFAVQAGPGATVVPPGEWGGVGIEVRVLTNTVQVKFRCDSGTTFVPLTLDSSGAFNLPGAFTWCPAPCLLNIPAHFQGQVTGSRLTMSVLWSDDGQLSTSGPFTATLGQKPELEGGCPRCLAGNALIDTPNGLVPVKDLVPCEKDIRSENMLRQLAHNRG